MQGFPVKSCSRRRDQTPLACRSLLKVPYQGAVWSCADCPGNRISVSFDTLKNNVVTFD